MSSSFADAVRRMESARAMFDYVESEYFEGRASETRLREATAELTEATAELAAAHQVCGAGAAG